MKIRNLPKQVLLLGWISLFADLSSELMYPLIPLFVVNVLGAEPLLLGIIEGLAQAIVSILSVIIGVISDHRGKRVGFIRIGYGLPILGKGLLIIAGSWTTVLLGRVIDRFGKGLRSSPRDALIDDACEPKFRGSAFGFHRMMDTIGAVLGVFAAAALLWVYDQEHSDTLFKLVFIQATIIATVSFFITLALREKDSVDTAFNQQFTSFSFFIHSVGNLGPKYWTTLAVLTLFAFANSSDTFLLLKASDLGLQPLEVVLLYGLYNLIYASFSYFFGKLSDSYGRWKIIISGWLIYALVYLGIASLTEQSLYLWMLFGLYGLYMALTDGVSKALVIDCVGAKQKGAALGMLYMVLGFSTLTSNILAGYLWQTYGSSLPFIVGAICALIASVAAVVVCVYGRRVTAPAGKS